MTSIIVAVGDNYLIGNKNNLPWHHKSDMKFFMKTTLGQCVIAGKKTWQSLPSRPLKGRQNIVVSRHHVEGVLTFTNLGNAVVFAQSTGKEVFLIGGRQIYVEALEKEIVNKIYMSYIPGKYQGDVFFPQLSSGWEMESFKPYHDFAILILKKG